MRLWTIQTTGWFEELQTRGRKSATYSRVDYDFRPHYRWMAQQMAKRIGTDSRRCPTFAWYRYDSKHPRPDLRSTGHLPTGTHGVRIEIKVADEQVLLSDFNMWHSVLNQSYLSGNEKEGQQIEAQLKADTLIRQMIEDSWNRIFDLNFGDWRSWGKRSERIIQACVESVSLEQVRRVDHFIAR